MLLSSNWPDYKVNKSMFVRLVRNIFSVVAGASVRKKCNLWGAVQSQPSLLVSYLEIQPNSVKHCLWDWMNSTKDSKSTMMPFVRTTKSIQTPWPVQLFTAKNATVQNSLEFGNNRRHTVDLFDQHQSGWREGSSGTVHARRNPYKEKGPGEHVQFSASQASDLSCNAGCTVLHS